MPRLSSIEFCAGAGGQALGLERAGFTHDLLLDSDADCCATLRHNRPEWRVICADMRTFTPQAYDDLDLLAAGLPCPPFSIAGKQLGHEDERDLFPAALRLIAQTNPKFVLIENVRGFLSKGFQPYRTRISEAFSEMGYCLDWRLFNATSFGVSQSRSRVTIVAGKTDYWKQFRFPEPTETSPKPVGELLYDLMAARGWHGVDTWKSRAHGIAPTIVGGSKKHGGPDLGPTRARATWKLMGVNGGSIAETAPDADFNGLPRLTTRMVARLQGFPDDWHFTGKKTSAYRQVGNAFPPPVAQAVGTSIAKAIAVTEGTAPVAAVAAE